MSKRDEILDCTRDAAKGAGFDPDDERITAMRRNIAAVWLADYQLEREELVAELAQIRDRLLGVKSCVREESLEARFVASSVRALNHVIARLA